MTEYQSSLVSSPSRALSATTEYNSEIAGVPRMTGLSRFATMALTIRVPRSLLYRLTSAVESK